MSSTSESIDRASIQLSPEERAELADNLWLSLALGVDVDAAWAHEIKRRGEGAVPAGEPAPPP